MPFGLIQEHFDEVILRGLGELLLTLGVLAQIENDSYELVAVQSNSGAYVPGEKYPLGNSFCKQVMIREELVSEIKSAGSRPKLHHPLYRSLPLECFIGAPVYLHGELWGALDFSSMSQRDKPFSQKDRNLVLELAEEMSALISSSGFLLRETDAD